MAEVKVDVMTANEIQPEQKEDVSLKKVFELAMLVKEGHRWECFKIHL